MARAMLSELLSHPDNPRVGNVALIADSLMAHGQYRPIVVSSRSKRILAGNHTAEAARRLGWSSIDVAWIDCDEQMERRILLADNRASDLSSYDDGMLAQLLMEFDSLDGTGYTEGDYERLVRTDDGGGGGGGDKDSEDDGSFKIRLGSHVGVVDGFEYDRWASVERELGSRKDIVASIRLRLDIPSSDGRTVPRGTSTPQPVKSSAVKVPIASLRRHPNNPREGDIGAIASSLQEFGQYKPIVVTTDGVILAGNHVAAAAAALGWDEVEVVMLEVDEQEALRILLVDNRASDAASYDDDALRRLLLTVNLTGTGWEQDDVAEFVGGGPSRPGPNRGRKSRCVVGEWSWSEPRHVLFVWSGSLEHDEVSDRLGLPRSSVEWE